VPVLEFLRQYTLREYTAVVAVALMGAAGVVLMLSAASGGTAGSGETLLKRETATRAPSPTSSADAAHAASVERAKERARLLAERRRIRALRAQRAARRAAVLAQARAKSAAKRTVARRAPRPASAAPSTPVVDRTPSPAPQQKRAVAPAPKPTPKKSGPAGGGGGTFDDSG
jgi:hypothetical protein